MYYRNVLYHEYHFSFSGFTVYKRKDSNVIFFMGAQDVLEDMLGNHTVHNHLRSVLGSMNFPYIEYKINSEIYCDFDDLRCNSADPKDPSRVDQYAGPESGEDAYAMAQERASDPPEGVPLFTVTIFPKYTFRNEYETFLSIKVHQGSIWKEEGSSVVRYRFYKATYLEGNENSTLIPYYPMKSEEYAIYIRHEIRKLHNYHFGNGLFNRTFKLEVLRLLFTNPNYFDVEIDYRSASCLHFASEQEYPILDASMFFPLTVMEITGLHHTQSPSIQWLLEMIGKIETNDHNNPMAQCSGSSAGSPTSDPLITTCDQSAHRARSENEPRLTPLMAVVPDLEMEISDPVPEESLVGKRKLDQFKEEHLNDPNDPIWKR